MGSSALLQLILLVTRIDGSRAAVEDDLVRYLRPSDVGRVQYEISVGGERKIIDVGSAEVVSVEDGIALVELTSDREVQQGFGIRFEVPFERIEPDGRAAGLAGSGDSPPAASEASPTPEDRPVRVRVPARLSPATLEDRVLAWADAWSSKDVGGYLSFYAASHRPEGTSRPQWEAQRRARIEAPEFIEVTIGDFAVLSATARRAEVRFEQAYRSNTYGDRVTKTLVLELDDGEWKIVSEESAPLESG